MLTTRSLAQRPRWPRFVVAGLHRNVTLLAVAFLAVHVVTTVADGYAPIGLKDAVIPFLSPYRPIWLGLGALAFDLLLALIAHEPAARAVRLSRLAGGALARVRAPGRSRSCTRSGTGSDARTGWLAALGVASHRAPSRLAVLVRLARATAAPAPRACAARRALALAARAPRLVPGRPRAAGLGGAGRHAALAPRSRAQPQRRAVAARAPSAALPRTLRPAASPGGWRRQRRDGERRSSRSRSTAACAAAVGAAPDRARRVCRATTAGCR